MRIKSVVSLVFASFFMAACDPITTARVLVVDTGGEPIADLPVQVSFDTKYVYERNTDESGCLYASKIGDDRSTFGLSIENETYQPVTFETGHRSHHDIVVTLAKTDEADASIAMQKSAADLDFSSYDCFK